MSFRLADTRQGDSVMQHTQFILAIVSLISVVIFVGCVFTGMKIVKHRDDLADRISMWGFVLSMILFVGCTLANAILCLIVGK